MARCELSGKGPVVKNLVSHSNIKTKSRAFMNIQQKRVYSKALDQMVSLKIAASVIKTLDHIGGLDAFLLRADDDQLSPRARVVRDRVARKLKKKRTDQAKAKKA